MWADPANIDSISNVDSVDFITQSRELPDHMPGEQAFTETHENAHSLSEGNVDAMDLLDMRDSLANN